LFFGGTREKVFDQGGLRPHEPKGFADSLFIFGLFILSLFFLRTTEKEFLLSKQSFENSFIIKRFFRFSFYFGLFIFSLFFARTREKGFI